VITQEELENRLSLSDPSLAKAKSIVMVSMCRAVGGRSCQNFLLQPNLLQCSSQNAIRIKEINPEASVTNPL